MKVTVNGDEVSVKDGANLIDLLESLELRDAKIAIELNQNIVPRSQHSQQLLQAGDSIEIVHAIGGG
ncbi:MAG: sulfur carrier protein ThiS [Pseudohongiellaceae bacterium]|nr:sulfur carrier protein ThiS [Pseudohongiellaceae bacterium]